MNLFLLLLGAYLGLKAAAEMLGVAPVTLRRMVSVREITYLQRSKHSPILFRPDWLVEWANRKTVQAGGGEVAPPKPEPAPPKPRMKELDWSQM